MDCLTFLLSAQMLAPNAPGADTRWEGAGKQGVGTANSLDSKIRGTLQGGALTEIFYPTADMANVQNLQLEAISKIDQSVKSSNFSWISRGKDQLKLEL